MAVSYEEALSTLTSMFGSEGSKWTTDSLDQVLRHHEGHMENTVEAVLGHGDGDPNVLIQRLKDPSAAAAAVDMDEEIARQLAKDLQKGNIGANNEPVSLGAGMDEEIGRQLASSSLGAATDAHRVARISTVTPPVAAPKARTPAPVVNDSDTLPRVDLPSDFLRIPGYKHRTTTPEEDADEQLARMLQEEDFLKELKGNPEFAYLARGGGFQQKQRVNRQSRANAGYPGASRGANDGPNIIENLSKMGEAAKQKLALFAAQFNQQNKPNHQTRSTERRGLLDDDDAGEEELLFAVSNGNAEMEMKDMSHNSWSSKPSGKKND
uniref:CUE domain-containing protein n=1 Tax=Leptocylindrus danicus TaxID=163516 RepID=A0A7S2L3U3_9STRA|mmetsp:Transcript_3077/g.4468  ORF Transcript_3077/g.4468 Transcript_3077/m.4468 type:complete len:323 (+) Transcript_3077:84-1052(+)|eukprot:CAMPEP_0116030414 /NCGR_PEP_ID=MMETSP0321-20121206/16841_1 /TAXON_ID=163516 /ORGANISM="Leptocylindrus danicus var. danicus, Strain B650" /LENGTH=322 /DNA_ID=CAMNT_0003505217 /DNA_START=68 /DNA_END=1036 /DNA_ORIENTATION=+